MEPSRDRGISPVIGVVLMVALVVLLAAVVFVFTSGLTEVGQGPAPIVDSETDEFVAGCSGCGPDDQVVTLRHESGDPVDVENVEIEVDVAKNDKQGRIVDLPASGNDLDGDNVEGTEIFDLSFGAASGTVTANGPDDDGEWQAGDRLQFRIKKSGAGVDLDPGDEVTVTVVHAESDSVITEETLEAKAET